MEQNMERLLYLYASYSNQMRNDSICSIVCYQPILHRNGCQKKLSAKEIALKAAYPYDMPDALRFDSTGMKLVNNYLPEVQKALNRLGPHAAYLKSYHFDHFINKYISPKIDSIVTAYGRHYIDLGKNMMALPDTFEFYMDYTHTTPAGNQFIAEQIAQPIIVHFSPGAKK
jgi:hypothetical protein